MNLAQNGSPTAHSNNGYSTNVTQLSPANTNVVWTNITYEIGPLGRFYLPTNSPLINTGSVSSAASVGLFHYTTTANPQTKETNSVLDIGLHWIAATNGVPIDTDGDLLADYVEDKDGDGTKDSDETAFSNPATDQDTDGDGVSDYLELLQGRNPLASGSVADTNGVINLRVYTPLK